MLGETLEAIAGTAATSWTGIGAVVGGVVAIHGTDVAGTGLKQLISGEEESTLTSQAIQSTGVSQQSADALDSTISIVGTGGASHFSSNANTFAGITAATGISGSQVSGLAKKLNIFSGQKTLNKKEGAQIVAKYLKQMHNDSFNKGAAGFITKDGKTVLTEGNHAMNAALKYSLQTGDYKYINFLIRNGNFTPNVNLSEYGINAIHYQLNKAV